MCTVIITPENSENIYQVLSFPSNSPEYLANDRTTPLLLCRQGRQSNLYLSLVDIYILHSGTPGCFVH